MKKIYFEVHEDLIAEYLEKHPDATRQEAIDATYEDALEKTAEKYADWIDRASDMRKEGGNGF